MPDTVSDAGDTSDQSPSSHRASILKKPHKQQMTT